MAGPEGCRIDNTPTTQLPPEVRKERVAASMRSATPTCEAAANVMQALGKKENADKNTLENCTDLVRMQLEIANCDCPTFAGEPSETAIPQLANMIARMMRREGISPENQEGYVKAVVDKLRQTQANADKSFLVRALNAVNESRSALKT